MKKLIYILTLISILCLILCLTSCGHEHVFGEWQVAKSPTCNKEGVEARYCECGDSEIRSIAPSHNYCEETKKNATCTEDGTKNYTCSTCGESYEEIIPKGHIWLDSTCTLPRSCQNCDETEGHPLGHTTIEGICDRCKNTIDIDIRLFGVTYTKPTWYDTTEMTFKNIFTTYADGKLQLRFRAVKTDDEYGIYSSYPIGFGYKITDSNGKEVVNDSWILYSITLGQYVDEVIEIPLDWNTEYYTIWIDDYPR